MELSPVALERKQHYLKRKREPLYCIHSYHVIQEGLVQKLGSDHAGPYCSACVRAGRGSNLDSNERPGYVRSGSGRRHGTFYLVNLKRIKNERELRYKDIAEASGVNYSSIKDYALMNHAATPERAQAVAKALGVTVEELKGEG
jgi:hypothetical protein